MAGERADPSGPASVGLVIVGDEIVSGEVRDENAQFLTSRLTAAGITVREIRQVRDALPAIVQALSDLGKAADAVLATGGIGPTHDDLTRQAVAQCLGCPCTRHPEAERRLRRGIGATITPAELTMADLPVGAELLDGEAAPAFGFRAGHFYALPGVPYFLKDIANLLLASWARCPYLRADECSELREGLVAEDLRQLQERFPEVGVGIYPIQEGRWRIRVVLRSFDAEALARARAGVQRVLARRRG